MFLRSIHRKKDGKEHRYFSIVENHRIASHKTVQRTVLYLGEINDQQQAAWRKTLSVFDEQQQEYANLSLFPDDREIPDDAVDSLQVKLSGLELRRPRLFGSCWLACALWRQLGLDEFWDARLAGTREEVPWGKVLQLLVVNRVARQNPVRTKNIVILCCMPRVQIAAAASRRAAQPWNSALASVFVFRPRRQ
jgi:hypothetical protein